VRAARQGATARGAAGGGRGAAGDVGDRHVGPWGGGRERRRFAVVQGCSGIGEHIVGLIYADLRIEMGWKEDA